MPFMNEMEQILDTMETVTLEHNSEKNEGKAVKEVAAAEVMSTSDSCVADKKIELNKVFSEKDSKLKFDVTQKYSDEYYEEYIAAFEPNRKKRHCYFFFKRLLDIFISLFSIIIFLPLFLIIAIAIKCDSKGPVLFRQERVGKNGKVFQCLKFRSMKITAPKDTATSILDHPETYMTRVGKFLRKSSLDELPQLFCCLSGKMSIIGYRPLILSEAHCNDMRAKLGVFAMKPGISGYAQVHGRDDVYYKNKAIMDAYYVKHASLWLDIKLFFRTLVAVLRREGNDTEKMR